MSRPGITRIGAKMLIPYILLLALYVQFHGDYGPGGGFQAGVIFAAAFILYALVYGLNATLRVMPREVVEKLIGLGVLIYAGVGVLCMLLGGNFLEYEVLTWGDGHAQLGVEPVPELQDALINTHGDGYAAGDDHGGGHAANNHTEANHAADGHGGDHGDGGHGDGGHGDGGHGDGGHGGEHGGGHHGVLPQGQHLGLFLIEFGVGVTVFAVMLTIFYSFAGRGRS